MDNKLLSLLDLEALELSNGFKKASVEGYGTPQEVSDRREEVFHSFISKYFPFPYRIVKGNIIDTYGHNSNSIDCLVLNPAHPYTIDSKNEKASVIFAEGVDYAIEIKSELVDRNEIERALKQIQSVKKLRRVRTGLVFENKLSDEGIEFYKTIPGIIVAEKTYSDIVKLLETITFYYVNNNIPSIEQFDLLYINCNCLIINFRPNSYFSSENTHGLYYYEGGTNMLSAFLFALNIIPQSVPMINESIMEIYLKACKPEELKYVNELNIQLQCLPSIKWFQNNSETVLDMSYIVE